MSTDLETFDADGEAVETRFASAQDCWSFARRLEKDDQDHKSPIRAQILAMRNMAPPWKRTPATADRMNINWGEGKQVLKDRKTPFLIRLSQESEPIEVETWEKDPQRADDFRRRLSMGASAALLQWTGHARELSGAADDMGMFGLGTVIWPEDTDPRFERVPSRRVFFPSDSVPDIDRINAVVVRHRWTATDLWEKYNSPAAEDLGWQREGLKSAMRYLFTQGNDERSENSGSVPFETIEQRIRTNFMGEWISGFQMDVYHVVYRDFSGKFSVRMVATVPTMDQAVYLRERDDAYDELSQFLGIFPLVPDEESLAAIQGYGHELVPKAQASSRAKCQLMDHWDRATSLWMQSASPDQAMRMQLQRHGPFTFVNTQGAEMAEFAKQDKMPADLGALGMLEGELRRGTPTNTANQFGRAANRPSATAEDIQEQQANEAVMVDVAMFEMHLDRVLAEFYRRLTLAGNTKTSAGQKVRKVFKDWMKHLDVPKEIYSWENVRQVMAKRTVGPGSGFVRKQAAAALMQVRGALPAEGQHEAMELYVSAHAGARHVRRFLPQLDRLQEASWHHWTANQESLAIKQGQAVLGALGDQNDGVHIRQHLKDFEPELTALQEGELDEGGVAQLAGALNQLMPHFDTHLQRLEGDDTRKAEYETLKPVVEEWRRIALSVDKEVRELTERQRQAEETQAAQAQLGPGPDIEAQLKVEEKAQGMQQKEAEHEQKLRQSQESFQGDEQRKAAAFQLEQSRKLREAARGNNA